MSEPKAKVMALEGNAKFQRLLAGVPETAGMKSGYVTLKRKESVGLHSTEAREEIVIFLAGKAQVYLKDKPKVFIQEKQLLYLPPYTEHDIKNIGKKDLCYVYVVSPLKNTKS
jgi:mannose-6-phosphate isomerase-like protein (cupin superfamily)